MTCRLVTQVAGALVAEPQLDRPLSSFQTRNSSPKRGLVYIPSSSHPEDDQVWVRPGSDLTWYYNYGQDPTFNGSGSLLFIPMNWGPYYDDFNSKIRARVQAGIKVPYILSYNEPDLPYEYGGSNATPVAAANHWISELEPLHRDLGIAIGAPAVSGGEGGWTWLQEFFTACAGRCTPSFLPLHCYGAFQGLADNLGRARGTYANMTLWVTEWAPAHEDLPDTEGNFNTSVAYMDGLSYVDRYSYFGSFRSDVSNVGPNATMLDANGKVTDIGSWYLNIPK